MERRTRKVIEAELKEAQEKLAAHEKDETYERRLAKALEHRKATREEEQRAREALAERKLQARAETGLVEIVTDEDGEKVLRPVPAVKRFIEEFFGWKWELQHEIDRSKGAVIRPFDFIVDWIVDGLTKGNAEIEIGALRKKLKERGEEASRAWMAHSAIEQERHGLVGRVAKLQNELDDCQAREEKSKRRAKALATLDVKEQESMRANAREKFRSLNSGGSYEHNRHLQDFAKKLLAEVAKEKK